MALIDVELSAARFQELVQLLASAGPIPVGVANGLGAGRLIAAITYDSVTAGIAPGGFTLPPGTVAARANVTLRHVGIADLDANPTPVGVTTGAFAFLLISADTERLRIQLLALDVGGAITSFATPIPIARRNLPPLAGIGALAGVVILFSDGVATIRLATSAADSLLSPPLNSLSATAADWAIRVSGEFFAELLRNALIAGTSPPPAGTNVEEEPEASWNGSGVSGSVGLEKPDACWGLFEDVDISVTVNASLSLAPNVAVAPPVLVLNLTLASDASDWDAFRCWLGSGGLGSLLLGGFIGPIVGIVAGAVSLVAISEIVRLDAGEGVSGAAPPSGFTPTGSTDTSASYTATIPLPTLAGLGIGTTSGATVGSTGLVISGSITILPATHDVAFTPPPGELPARFVQNYSCNSRVWVKSVEIPAIQVTDAARVSTVALGQVPVTVFPSSSVTPANRWSIDFDSPAIDQYVRIVASSAVQPGDRARLYLHTSAGIRRYDTAALVDIAPPTPEQNTFAVARCLRAERMFMAWEEIRWLVDPPPFDYGRPPLRQWQFAFANLPAGVRLEFLQLQGDRQATELMTVTAGRAGEATFEFVTDGRTELALRHDRERLEKGRVKQRWLIPTNVLSAGRQPSAIMRSGTQLGVASSDGLIMVDLETGRIERRVGNFELAKELAGELVAKETRSFALGKAGLVARQVTPIARGRRGGAPASFSVTLSRGRVAALHGDRLIIAIPYGEA